jgi:hypothetical protein
VADEPLFVSNLDAAYEATDHIWDDREAYIRAVFDKFGIDPGARFEEPDAR